MGRTTRSIVALLSLVVTAGALVASPAGAADPAPRTLSLSGANDWTCTPGRAHPHPVAIVHGTFGDSPTYQPSCVP